MRASEITPFRLPLIAVIYGVLAGAVLASTPGSSSYSIVSNATDGGGTQAASTSYSSSGSLGGIGSLASAASPAETIKSGYIAQIYNVVGLVLDTTFVANGTTQQLTATQLLDDGTTLVLNENGLTWSTVGQLPGALNLDASTGVISGTITTPGSYSFTILVTDALGHSAQQTFTGTIGPLSFTDWESQPNYFSTQQMKTLSISGPTATPQNDGIPNLLKYLYDINPAQPMGASDQAALPVFAVTISGDLTLVFRENSLMTGVTLGVQTSTDLQNWSPVSLAKIPTAGSYTIQATGNPNPATGDSYMIIDYKPLNPGSRQFIRLNVTQP